MKPNKRRLPEACGGIPNGVLQIELPTTDRMDMEAYLRRAGPVVTERLKSRSGDASCHPRVTSSGTTRLSRGQDPDWTPTGPFDVASPTRWSPGRHAGLCLGWHMYIGCNAGLRKGSLHGGGTVAASKPSHTTPPFLRSISSYPCPPVPDALTPVLFADRKAANAGGVTWREVQNGYEA